MNFRGIFAAAALLFLAGIIQAPGQVITNVTPPLGAAGDQVVIWGGGFAPGNQRPASLLVKLGNTLVSTNPFAVVQDYEIAVSVPSGATTAKFSVQINGGTPVYSQKFTVIGPGPYVTNFTPVAGYGGGLVTIQGVHFIVGTASGLIATNVSFNGKLGTLASGPTANQLQYYAPANVTSGPLTVLCSWGHAYDFNTITNTFYNGTNAFGAPNTFPATNFFVSPISITGFSPGDGSPGTSVSISGVNFLGCSAVTFGGVPANSFTVTNNNFLQAFVPTNAPSGPIEIFTPAGSQTTSGNFRLLPTAYGFSPAFGPPGASVVITGANFNEGSGPGGRPVVSFNGTSASVSGFSFGAVTSSVPAGASSGPITLTTTNGSAMTSQIFYLPASISGFAPNAGAPGTLVAITGQNFTDALGVDFNGTPAGAFYVTNNNHIGAVVPAGASSGPIHVFTPAGAAASSGAFYAPPLITGFSPDHGLPGTTVAIFGTNLLGSTGVLFNGLNAASFANVDNGQLNAVVPNNAQTGPITVLAPAGTNVSAADFVLDYSNDVGVIAADSPDPVFVGSNLTYTLTVFNNGPYPASNVSLTDSLPVSVTLRSASASQGSLNGSGHPILGNLGTLGVGGQATITLTVAPQAIGSITNLAWVGGGYPDPALANNTNALATTVWPLPFLSAQWLFPNRVKVLWPAPLSNFTLQFQTALAGGNAAWTNVTATKYLSGTNVFVTQTNLGPAKFYRLTN